MPPAYDGDFPGNFDGHEGSFQGDPYTEDDSTRGVYLDAVDANPSGFGSAADFGTFGTSFGGFGEGEPYPDQDDIMRGVTLAPGSAFRDATDSFVEPDLMFGGGGGKMMGDYFADASFGAGFGDFSGDTFGKGAFGKGDFGNTGAQETQSFTEQHAPPAVPIDPYFRLERTTIHLSMPDGGPAFLPPRAPHEIGNAILRFFDDEIVHVEVLKVRQAKFWVSVRVFIQGQMCVMKVRTYQKQDAFDSYAVEFQRRQGCCVIFKSVYNRAVKFFGERGYVIEGKEQGMPGNLGAFDLGDAPRPPAFFDNDLGKDGLAPPPPLPFDAFCGDGFHGVAKAPMPPVLSSQAPPMPPSLSSTAEIPDVVIPPFMPPFLSSMVEIPDVLKPPPMSLQAEIPDVVIPSFMPPFLSSKAENSGAQETPQNDVNFLTGMMMAETLPGVQAEGLNALADMASRGNLSCTQDVARNLKKLLEGGLPTDPEAEYALVRSFAMMCKWAQPTLCLAMEGVFTVVATLLVDKAEGPKSSLLAKRELAQALAEGCTNLKPVDIPAENMVMLKPFQKNLPMEDDLDDERVRGSVRDVRHTLMVAGLA